MTASYVKFVHERDGERCRKCGTKGSKDNPLQVHHKKPRCKGGTNNPDNLELLCANCHKREHLENGGYPQREKKRKKKYRRGRRHH